jgi:uncharacterized protein HemY
MVPPELKDFLVATTGASASFIGLLFVAISLAKAGEQGDVVAEQTKRILAESSYAALLSIFFISIVALIPQTTIGWVVVVMAIAGLSNVAHLRRYTKTKIRYNRAILGFSALVYIGQGLYGLTVLLAGSNSTTSKYSIMTLMLFLFSLALGRAWELTGIREN